MSDLVSSPVQFAVAQPLILIDERLGLRISANLVFKQLVQAHIPLGIPRHWIQSLQKLLRLRRAQQRLQDRKSTRLNSSHQIISYAVFCLKKKKNTQSRDTA